MKHNNARNLLALISACTFSLTAIAGTDMHIGIVNHSKYPLVIEKTGEYCMHKGKAGQWHGLQDIVFPNQYRVGYLDSKGGGYCSSSDSAVEFTISYIDQESVFPVYKCNAMMGGGRTRLECDFNFWDSCSENGKCGALVRFATVGLPYSLVIPGWEGDWFTVTLIDSSTQP